MKKLVLASLVTAASLAALGSTATAQVAYGLGTGGLTLFSFNLSTPTISFLPAVAITGLGTGESISAIDIRPSTGALYGFSSANQLYTISSTGVATRDTGYNVTLATPPANMVGSDMASSRTTSGTVSINVNPNVPAGPAVPVGALRIVDTAGNNLRYAFATSTLNLDDTLTRGMITPTIVGVAYTNSDVDPATGTTIYYLDSVTDSLYSTATPNDGNLSLIGSGLGVDLDANTGFDIFTDGATNSAYLTSGGTLYSVNLAAGTASSLGALGGSITDIAVVPEPSTYVMLSIAGLGLLVWNKRRKLATVRS